MDTSAECTCSLLRSNQKSLNCILILIYVLNVSIEHHNLELDMVAAGIVNLLKRVRCNIFCFIYIELLDAIYCHNVKCEVISTKSASTRNVSWTPEHKKLYGPSQNH